jgi:branched-chain amino acid transport system permease protein
VGASLLTLFQFVVSELTRSWLLYQGVVFVLVMLFAPRGIGGIVEAHARHAPWLSTSKLALPYAVALLGGLLVAAGGVFVIEALEILFSPEYAVVRRDAGGAFPPFELFGVDWRPFSPLTWGIPLLLAGVGGWLLVTARRAITPHWEHAREAAAAEGTVS